jgi:UDP-glucose 6-dehydrogenase
MHWLPLEAAELQKYVHNCGNAIKISTYNWFRLLGDAIGVRDVDIEYIIQLSVVTAEGLYDPEYGTRDLGPYAGDCLPKDLKTLLSYARTAGVQTGLLEAVEAINREIAKRQ